MGSPCQDFTTRRYFGDGPAGSCASPAGMRRRGGRGIPAGFARPEGVTFRIIWRTSFNAIWRTSRERRRKSDGRKRPLCKPVAIPERNAIHFRNAQTPANRVHGVWLQNRSFPQRHEKSCRPSALFPSVRPFGRNVPRPLLRHFSSTDPRSFTPRRMVRRPVNIESQPKNESCRG